MNHRRAFTLIELLVVIAIIAILAAILFPVFAQAKMAAKKSSDLASVKQINLSTMMYNGDSDDICVGQNNNERDNFPTPWNAGADDSLPAVVPAPVPLGFMDPRYPQAWAREIQPYMKSLPLMVSVAAPKASGGVAWAYSPVAGAGNSSWMMNGLLHRKSMTSMSSPAELVIFQGSTVTTKESLVQPAMVDGVNSVCNGVDVGFAGNTFGKGANYGWADGHSSYKNRTAITFRNMGMSGIVHRRQRSGWGDVPNTTGLTDPILNDHFWDTWGECKIDAL